MRRERGRKKGLCMKYSKWGKLAGLLMLYRRRQPFLKAWGR